jgi:RimJ/RimL family protein N-acetyltransferase
MSLTSASSAITFSNVNLRPAAPEDRFLIRRWLADPQAQTTWGSTASAEAEVTLAMGSESALSRIVEAGGDPVGYVQAAESGLWGDHQRDLAAGTWRIDLIIGVTQARQRGCASSALASLAREVFTTTLALACSGLVPIRNEALARAYEQAGFRWQRIWNDPQLGPAWVMLRERGA